MIKLSKTWMDRVSVLEIRNGLMIENLQSFKSTLTYIA